MSDTICISEIIKTLPEGTRFLITPEALVIDGPDEWTCVERMPGAEHVIQNVEGIRAALRLYQVEAHA